MKFWLKGLAVLLVIGVWLGWGAGQAVAQCTGQAHCCSVAGMLCKIGSNYHGIDFCRNISNLGRACESGGSIGTCVCSGDYYVGCNAVASSGVMWYGSGQGNNRYGDATAQGIDYGANSSVRTVEKREGYEYFYRLFEMGSNPAEDPELAGLFNETDMG